MPSLQDEFVNQEKLLEEINKTTIRGTGTTVRKILKIPRGMQGDDVQ